MDSNNMYPNQQTGDSDPGSGQTTNYGDNAYQNNQTMNYGENAYQDNNGYNQNAYQNPGYQPYQYNDNKGYPNSYSQGDLEEPVKVGEWLISMLIMLIPCVNLIMIFVWAFSKTEKKSKSNYFKACLIWSAIILGLYLILVIALVAMGIGLSSGSYGYY